MALLKELSSEEHSDWKVAPNCGIDIAKTQHILNLKVTEVGRAVSSFPVFFTKVGDTDNWAISALTSLELNRNLFVSEEKWQATYLPSGIQTYPFFLMQAPSDNKKFTVGIEEDNPVFSTQEGEPIFESKGKAGERLSIATVMLQDDLKNELHTFKFIQLLNELDLLVQIDVLVQYQSGTTNSLTGLFTIDETKIQALDNERFNDLREKGYLAPVYGMLMSIYQLNGLLRLHNARGDAEIIQQVKIEQRKEQEQAKH